MDRGSLHVGGTYRFTVECFDTDGGNIALDDDPTIVVVKNGTPNADAVTAIDRDSDNKHFDCSYTPSGAVETDHFELRISVEIGSVVYKRLSEHFDVFAIERGTDSAYTGTPLDAAGVRTAVGLASANLDTQLSTIDTVVDSILVDTAEIGSAGAGLTEAGGTGDQLTAIPWNATWDTEVQSEVTDALNAYDPPTNTEMVAAFTEIKGATWSSGTDTLEAIRDASGGGSGSETEVLVTTTIATLASQTSFTLTAGSADNDAYNNQIAIITDQATSTQKAVVRVSDYVGTTPVARTVTLAAAPAFTIAAGDTVAIVAATGTANVTVTPLSAGDPQRVNGTLIEVCQGESKTHTISGITDSAGNLVNLIGKTLEAVLDEVDAQAGTHPDFEVVAVTVNSAASVSFTNTSLSSAKIGRFRWAVREPSNGDYVWARGTWQVLSTATGD